MALVKPDSSRIAKIKVIGVGGGGGNAVSSMVRHEEINGVEFIIVNTDAQVLLDSEVITKLQIGEKLTKGLGVGGHPEIGEQAAEESAEKIKELLIDSDMVFITAGMGGGTGTGASPVIAKMAKDSGALTIGIVTKPFAFEGSRRSLLAEEGVDRLREQVDTLIVIPNQRLMDVIDKKMTLIEAFKVADSVLSQAVGGISEIITTPGLVNVDFADVKSIMKDAGSALLGIGTGVGDNRAQMAARAAISSPLLDLSIDGARGVLFNITGGPDLTMFEVDEAAQAISRAVDPEANISFGAVIKDELTNQIRITVIATGFDEAHTVASLGPVVAAPPPEPKIEGVVSEVPDVENQHTEKTSDEENLETEDEEEVDQNGEDKPEYDEDFEIPAFLRRKIH